MKLHHQKTVAFAGDLGATAASLLLSASHWAEVLTPIVTLLVGLATLAWWMLRFFDRWQGGGLRE